MKITRALKISVFCLLALTSCRKGVKLHELVLQDNLYYEADSKIPYSGKVYEDYTSGKDSFIAEIDSGTYNGNCLLYYPTGEIKDSILYDKGVIVKFRRFLTSGLEMKVSDKLLFNSKQGLTCTIENNDTVLFSGLSVASADDKSISYTRRYINGELNGEAINYWANGQIAFYKKYKNGKEQGREVRYYNNGNLQLEANWKNGSCDGKKTCYYENGKIERIENYSEGLRNGKCVYYFDNGRIKAKGILRDDLREGDWVFYRSDGSIDAQQRFSHGVLLSKCQCCGKYYNYAEGWTARNPGFSPGAWDLFADGGAGGGPYCSQGCARRCE